MSEMSFEQMLEDSFKTIRNGEVVEGTVINVKPDEIALNIGPECLRKLGLQFPGFLQHAGLVLGHRHNHHLDGRDIVGATPGRCHPHEP